MNFCASDSISIVDRSTTAKLLRLLSAKMAKARVATKISFYGERGKTSGFCWQKSNVLRRVRR